MLRSELIYIQVNENSFGCMRAGKGIIKHSSIEPFSSKRLAIADFDAAYNLLNDIVGYSKFKYFLKPKPTLIMHQRYNSEDLSPVEKRVLREIAFNSGAREVFVWQGRDLSEEEVESGVYKNSQKFE